MPYGLPNDQKQCPQCGGIYAVVPDGHCGKHRGCDVYLDGHDRGRSPTMPAFRIFRWRGGRWVHDFEPDPHYRASVHGYLRYNRVPPDIGPARPSTSQAAPAPVRSPRPSPRLIRRASEAEELCAEWLRWMGFPGARATPPGADGGVDVIGTGPTGEVVAQVKFEAVPAGRPKMMELFGAGHALGAQVFVFVSSAGFTAQARTWADQVGMALFEFELNGALTPVNPAARRLFEG